MVNAEEERISILYGSVTLKEKQVKLCDSHLIFRIVKTFHRAIIHTNVEKQSQISWLFFYKKRKNITFIGSFTDELPKPIQRRENKDSGSLCQ